MKRGLSALLTAAALSVALVVPASAVAPERPFLGIGVCRYAPDNTFFVNVVWTNQTPEAGSLSVSINFKGPQLQTSSTTVNYIGPIPSESFVNNNFVNVFIGPEGPISDWNAWTKVSVSATGAFVDESRAVHQPHGGWPNCTFA